MPQMHSAVRAAILSVMQDSDYGFNARMAAALPAYGISEEIQINWATAEGTYYGPLGSAGIKLSTLSGRLTFRTEPAGSQFTGEALGCKWSGNVNAKLVFRLEFSIREGDDNLPEETEAATIAAAIEDSVVEVFQSPTIGWGSLGVTYCPAPDCNEGYMFEQLADGWAITAPILVRFKVEAQ
jgi:hypothetical protein